MIVKENKALLDKCTFSEIWIDSIDEQMIEYLIKQKVVKRIVNEYGEIYYSVSVKDQEYVYSSGHNQLINGFGTLQTAVANDGFGNLNCYTVDEYRGRLNQIKMTLSEKGIHINVENPVVSNMEINRTFRLDEDMNTYERVLNLLMALLPGSARLSTTSEWANKGKNSINKSTFYATSKITAKSRCYLTIKWYNKTKALKSYYKIILDEQYIRLEFTLHGSKKIKTEFGTNRFNELSDDIINEWFDKKIENWINAPIKKWQQEQHKKILKIMKECKRTDGYKWVNKCITRLLNEEIKTQTGHKPLVLDIEEVIPLVNELYPNGDKRKKTKAAFRRIAKEDASSITNRDDLKLQELLEKLMAKDVKTGAVKNLKNSTTKTAA